jgi:predicted patatin/cPLA2 family phospholipase
MRSIAASGFLRVLSDAGLLDSFDTLHGSSAGACAVAYCLAQQVSQSIGIFEDIGTRTVVNPYRIFSQPCMVDTDYIVDEVFSIKRRLDVEKIISERGALNIITTSVSDGLPIVHKYFETGDQIFQALKATLRVPGPFEYGIDINGMRHLDGGIAAPIPLFSAIYSGATHILILGTQRAGDYERSQNGQCLEQSFVHLLYGKQLEQAYVRSRQERASIIEHTPINADVLMRPSGGTYCSWSTVKNSTLRKVKEEAENTAKAYIQYAVSDFNQKFQSNF